MYRIFSVLLAISILFGMAACAGAAQPAATGPAAAQPAAGSGAELSGNITVSGAFALYPMMTRWAEEFKKAHPKVEFDVSAGGAGKGMSDTLGGAVDIGMVSRAVTQEEESKGAYWAAVVKDAVFPIVNAKNPVLQDLLSKGVTKKIFAGIYISSTIKTWGEVVGRPEIKDEIHVYTRSDSAGAADTWATFLGKKQENLKGVGVFGDPGLMDAVVKDPLGIGYNNLGYAFDAKTGVPVTGAAIVPIDKNNNGQADPDEVIQTRQAAIDAVASGKFPSPPARALYLVTKGKPSGLVQAFMLWTLTDGQKFVGEAGFIELAQDQLNSSIQKIR